MSELAKIVPRTCRQTTYAPRRTPTTRIHTWCTSVHPDPLSCVHRAAGGLPRVHRAVGGVGRPSAARWDASTVSFFRIRIQRGGLILLFSRATLLIKPKTLTRWCYSIFLFSFFFVLTLKPFLSLATGGRLSVPICHRRCFQGRIPTITRDHMQYLWPRTVKTIWSLMQNKSNGALIKFASLFDP